MGRGASISPLPESELGHMRAYLQAALASPQLRRVDLCFSSYIIQDDETQGLEAKFGPGRVFQSRNSPKLTSLVLGSVAFRFDEREPLLPRLGNQLGICVTKIHGLWATFIIEVVSLGGRLVISFCRLLVHEAG